MLRILWDLPLLQQRMSSAALEERAQGAQARPTAHRRPADELRLSRTVAALSRTRKENSNQLAATSGRNVLIDYYVYRECIELSSFSKRSMEDVLKADWRAWVRALISLLL
jgi:hypothetical protein